MSLHDSPFAGVFEQLTERMGVPHTYGSSASQRARVEWDRSGAITPEPCPYRVEGQKVLGRLAHPHLAAVFGDSDVEVSARVAQLWGHLDELVGPPQGTGDVPDHHGYVLKPGEVKGIAGGDGTGSGYVCDVAVTLRTLVVSQIRGTADGRATLTVTPSAPAALTPTSIEAL